MCRAASRWRRAPRSAAIEAADLGRDYFRDRRRRHSSMAGAINQMARAAPALVPGVVGTAQPPSAGRSGVLVGVLVKVLVAVRVSVRVGVTVTVVVSVGVDVGV